MFKYSIILLSAVVLFSCGVQLRDLSSTDGETVDYTKGLGYIKNPVLFADEITEEFWGYDKAKCKSLGLSDDAQSGSKSMHLKWKDLDCKFNGFGIEWDGGIGKNIESITSTASLTFQIKNLAGSQSLPTINFRFEDYLDNAASASLESGTSKISSNWSKVSIPLSAFEKVDDVEFDNVRQLVVTFEGMGEVLIDDLKFESAHSN